MIVFLISGLWHGASWTFILWGLLHGILSCIDRLFEKTEEKVFTPVRWLCTFAAVSILWLLFSAESIAQWGKILFRILLMQDTAVSEGLIATFTVAEAQFIYNVFHLNFFSVNVRGFTMLLFILAACIICFIPQNNYRTRDRLNIPSLLFAALAFVWGVFCLGSESVFVYFGF